MAYHPHRSPSMIPPTPTHPVPQLQGPFEESMLESPSDDDDTSHLNPITRRNVLLEAPVYSRVCAGRWKQKPGERYHPLWKLIAQVSFGIHLLAGGMARSEDEVMQILQSHVDEIDGFLERTTEDFDLAQEDIQERLRCLKLPLSHPATFEKMLEDRNFRLSIVEGNEKIEHIVDRTSQAMKDSLKDVQKGYDSTSCLESYLQGLAQTWHRHSVEHEAVFVAMLGNVEGWRKAFTSLHMQGNKLTGSLKKLTDIINEMQARAGEVSRRLLHQARVQHHQAMGRPTSRQTPISRFQTMPNKQLPGMPIGPPLRQTASSDVLRAHPSSRSSSQESLRQQALLNRSRTPQHETPSPRQVQAGASPRIIQIGSNNPGRIQSMVPSLMEAVPSPQNAPAPVEQHVDEGEQSERYFPPIELPAHVPGDPMLQVPMSKQTRLSTGRGPVQGNYSGQRDSRPGTFALVESLRANISTNQSSASPLIPHFNRSPQAPLNTSTTNPPSSVTNRSSSGRSPVTTQVLPPRSSSMNVIPSQHTKSDIRRPKDSVQHRFSPPGEDPNDNDEHSVTKNPSSQVVNTVIQLAHNSNHPDYNTQPGTPSWAKTKFAPPEKRRAELMKGAFGSHPPDLPLGSPPIAQANATPNPPTASTTQRPTSHTSSAGTLGEPGPAFPQSESGLTSVQREPRLNDQVWKRASAAAPEVVFVSQLASIPTSSKHLIMEMEGSTPPVQGVHAPGLPTHIMELEAPQQYFKLPPRPAPSATTNSRIDNRNTIPELHDMIIGTIQAEDMDRLMTDPSVIAATDSQQKTASADLSAQEVSPGPIIEQTVVVDEKSIIAQEEGERLPSSVFVPTPSIPLPPSPYEEELQPPVCEQHATSDEPLYLLPALAYQTPSPRLPPTPRVESVSSRPNTDTESGSRPRSEPQAVAMIEGDHAPPPPTSQEKNLEVEDLQQEATSVVPSGSSQSTSTKTFISAPEYDPFKAEEPKSEPSHVYVPEPVTSQVSTAPQREHRSPQPKHTRDTSSYDSENGWKAFFTGQPSPMGSNLSIRSIKRESVMDQQQQSPTSLNLTSAPYAGSAKDMVWFSKPFEDVKSRSGSNASSQLKELTGLGITTIDDGEDQLKHTVSAAS